MHVFPLSSNLDLISLPSCMAITAISPNVLMYFIYLHPFHKTGCEGALFFLALPLCYPTLFAVEMTSHQNSPLPFESIPAWISMALALPISIGILLSTTEFC